MGPFRGTFEERFWSKVDRSGSGCWEWIAGVNSYGYGMFNVRRADGTWKPDRAHRVSWQLANGPIPDGLYVCHHCDNPPCVRPDHLFLGTHADNLKDSAVKGRMHPGEAQGLSKLTTAQVLEIRARVAAGETQAQMCRDYGISRAHAHRLVHRKEWTHV